MEQEPGPDDVFHSTRTEARRAQFALNFLVILSAVAGAAFFAYVLYSIRPFSSKPSDVVEIPTSGATAILPTLEGEAGGLLVSVRNLDDAPDYSEAISERLRAEMAINETGRLYRLVLRNTGESSLSISLKSLELTAEDARVFRARWLGQVADREKASATGRLHIAQGAHEFELKAGGERQLTVFLPGDAPAVGDLRSGSLDAGTVDVPLEFKEIKAAP